MFVRKWLKKYMFKDDDNADTLATEISEKLADHRKFKSHGRHIGLEKACEYGLKVRDLEEDHVFQDLVLSVFHATTHTFGGTPAVKIIENHKGNAHIKRSHQILIEAPIPPPSN